MVKTEVKEESEEAGLKLNIQKTKIMASGPITSWQIDGETMETVRDFIFLELIPRSRITEPNNINILRLLLYRTKCLPVPSASHRSIPFFTPYHP